MSKNPIGSNELLGRTLVINGMKIEQGGNVRYGLFVQVLSYGDWFYPTSLHMRIDGALVDFGSGSEMSSDVVDCSGLGCLVDERYYFATTASRLWQLAEAESIIVRYGGRGGYIEREFSQANTANFADFVGKHVPRPTDTKENAQVREWFEEIPAELQG